MIITLTTLLYYIAGVVASIYVGKLLNKKKIANDIDATPGTIVLIVSIFSWYGIMFLLILHAVTSNSYKRIIGWLENEETDV